MITKPLTNNFSFYYNEVIRNYSTTLLISNQLNVDLTKLILSAAQEFILSSMLSYNRVWAQLGSINGGKSYVM